MNPHTAILESLAKIASYTTKLELSGVQLVSFGRLASLQTIIQFMGAWVCNDSGLQALTTKLCHIAINLNMDHLEWPFAAEDEQEIAAALTHIESMAQSLSIAGPHHDRFSTDAHRSLMQINPQDIHLGAVSGSVFSHNTINNTINSADPAVHRKVDNVLEHVRDAETCKFSLNSLLRMILKATQSETFAKHTAGTGDWFLKQKDFVNWRDGKTKFLWCPGIPGAGKTILSQVYAILIFLQANHFAALLLLSTYAQQEEQTSTQLLGSVLKQLVQQHSSISDHLVTLHKRGVHPSIAELFAALQTEVLLYSQVYIVVDALDECSESNQARELFFSSHSPGFWSLPAHVHLLITSRDILSISQEFGSTPRISIEAHNEDLKTYIRGRMTTDNKLKKLVKNDITLVAEIVDQVILKAAGMFLQVQLHLDALASQLNRKGLRTALALLPKGIMNSYDDIMARIRSQGDAEYELACQIFYWLAYAKQPLSIKQLQHAVAVSDDMKEMDFDAIVDVDVLTGVCAGLVVIREDNSYSFSHNTNAQIAQLVHYTTQEYFQLRQQYWFPNIHSSMAITCLTYLSFNTFNSTGISTDTSNHPLYRYATKYWGTHSKADEVATMQYILNFLKKKRNVAYAANQVWWPTTRTAHILAWLGLYQTLEELLSQDPTHATSIDTRRCTPLLYAVEYRHINIVKLLLEKNADPNACDKDQNTPLSYAAGQGHIDIVKLLLEKQADPNIYLKDQRTLLSYAVRQGHTAIVKLLLENNADPNACNKKQRTPLFYGARWGHTDIVKLLLGINADPNVCDKNQRTPLSSAAAQGHIDIVKLLLDKNADHNACDKYWYTPLLYAAEQGHTDIVKLLLEKNADPNACNKNQHTSLFYGARWGHNDIVKLLLGINADPNACDRNQRTPLSYAAQQDHTEIVRLLLEKDANPNVCDKDQRTPLSYAAEQDHIDIIKLLLEKNADPNACNKDQRTPLFYAAEQGHIDIVKLLLHKNADPNACNKDQCTPLFYAAEWGHIDIVKLLLENNSDPNVYNNYQLTPLFYAVGDGHFEIVKLLLEKNADPDACNKHQDTPLSYAAVYNHFEIFQLLLKYSDQISIERTLSLVLSIDPQEGYFRAYSENYPKIIKLLQQHSVVELD
ncbi:Pfs, NACHT and ankyrin domain protein [Mycena floridula]|nr:Pfs, NACHT and ankyrin domain protein [Mycena floridula]